MPQVVLEIKLQFGGTQFFKPNRRKTEHILSDYARTPDETFLLRRSESFLANVAASPLVQEALDIFYTRFTSNKLMSTKTHGILLMGFQKRKRKEHTQRSYDPTYPIAIFQPIFIINFLEAKMTLLKDTKDAIKNQREKSSSELQKCVFVNVCVSPWCSNFDNAHKE